MAPVTAAFVVEDGTGEPLEDAPRDLGTALKRGLRLCCPNCGNKTLFTSYLKVTPECPVCGEKLGRYRTDDFAPYLTIVIVGHAVVGAILAVEQAWAPPVWVQMAVALPVAAATAMLALPFIKGAVLALQWATRSADGDDWPGTAA